MKNKPNETAEVPISSLIDVIFLLIMFFVVTSDIEKEAFDVQIDLVKCENMKPVTEAPPLRVTINIQKTRDGKDDEANIYVTSTQIPIEGLKAELIGLKNLAGAGTVVMIRADKDVLFKHESDVIEAIKASGLSKIRIQAELQEKQ
jgi:biopolymer transport protein ExbD